MNRLDGEKFDQPLTKKTPREIAIDLGLGVACAVAVGLLATSNSGNENDSLKNTPDSDVSFLTLITD